MSPLGAPLFLCFCRQQKKEIEICWLVILFFLFSSSNKRKAGEKCEIATHKPLPYFFLLRTLKLRDRDSFWSIHRTSFYTACTVASKSSISRDGKLQFFTTLFFSSFCFCSYNAIVPLLRESILLQKASYARYYVQQKSFGN